VKSTRATFEEGFGPYPVDNLRGLFVRGELLAYLLTYPLTVSHTHLLTALPSVCRSVSATNRPTDIMDQIVRSIGKNTQQLR